MMLFKIICLTLPEQCTLLDIGIPMPGALSRPVIDLLLNTDEKTSMNAPAKHKLKEYRISIASQSSRHVAFMHQIELKLFSGHLHV